MATKVRSLVQRWEAVDADTRYYAVGVALAVPASLFTGVKTLKAVPHEIWLATMGAVATGAITLFAWPAVIPTLGVYGVFSMIDKRIN